MHFSFSILIPFIIYFIYLLRFYNNFQAQKLESSLVAREINGHKYFLFRNICYLGKERQFIFIWGNTSYISGIKTKNELKEINISPIRNHNKFTLKISFISNLTLIKDDSFEIIEIPTILLWRFKPDNLLHLIHDDLIPLFATLKDICDFNIEECSLKRNLAFLDGASPTLYDEWFSLFSKDVPINLTDKNICFREVNVGLRDTLWYQYGFDQPQGPIKQSNISSSLISDFVNFIKNKLDLKKELNKLTSLVINRKFTRRILNEDDLLSYIEEVFIGKTQIKILSENIFNGSSFKMVQEAISSELLIGMHGAAMAMALFLPKNAIVIELFPYGINPQYVSAIHALGQIPGIHFHYFSWINTNR